MATRQTPRPGCWQVHTQSHHSAAQVSHGVSQVRVAFIVRVNVKRGVVSVSFFDEIAAFHFIVTQLNCIVIARVQDWMELITSRIEEQIGSRAIRRGEF